MAQDVQDQWFVRVTTFSSIFAGIVGKIICHPIDTLRAKIQVQREMMTLNAYREGLIVQTFRNTMRTEGVKGLFKGLGISVVQRTGPAYSLYLTSYEWSKLNLQKIAYLQDNQGLCYFLAGLTAESISCIFWLPIDVVKERMQVQTNLKIYNYRNGLDAIVTILKTEGIVGLYRAYGATLASFGPFSALYFLFYEKLKCINSVSSVERFCTNPTAPGFFESMFLSGLSGSVAGFLVNPLEVVKLRMQVQRASKAQADTSLHHIGNFGYRNVLHGLYKMIQSEGFLSIYKGSLAKVLYTTPNTAICMSLSEVLRSYILDHYRVKH